MRQDEILTGQLLDEIALSVEELARACAVDPQWIVQRVEAGVLTGTPEYPSWYFASASLVRARRLISIERNFDANQELAALVVDLMEEVERLKGAGLAGDEHR
ncbi:MAG TPA: chaperone modulator CbpM [Methylophilaceae bacterium]